MGRFEDRLKKYGLDDAVSQLNPVYFAPKVKEEDTEEERRRKQEAERVRLAQRKAEKEEKEQKKGIMTSQLQARDASKRQDITTKAKETTQTEQLMARDETKRNEINNINKQRMDREIIKSIGGEQEAIKYGVQEKEKPTFKQSMQEVFNKDFKFDIKKYQNFNNDLNNDIANAVSYYGGMVGNKTEGKTIDLWHDIIKPHETEDYVEKRLSAVEKYLANRGGDLLENASHYGISGYEKPEEDEGAITSVFEGWYEREIRNMLSKEHLKQAEGEPNKVDLIDKFLEEHPELQDYIPIEKENSTWYKLKTGALRQGFGGVTRLGFDMLRDSALDPDTYAWTIALASMGTLSAPAIGSSLVGLLPTSASAPMLAGELGSVMKVAQSLKPVMAIQMGMQFGTTKAMATLEMVDSYQDMIETGVDPRIAKKIAPVVGVFNGLIEQVQWSMNLKGLPAMKTLLTKAEKVVLNEAVVGLTSVAKEYGVNVASNVLEEVIQGMITHVGTSVGIASQTAKYEGLLGLNSILDSAKIPETHQEFLQFKQNVANRESIVEVAKMQAINGLQTFWAMPLGSTALQSAGIVSRSYVDGKRAKAIETQVTNIDNATRQAQMDDITTTLEAVIGEEGYLDTVIEDYNETKDPSNIPLLTATKESFQANLNKGFTNEQKTKMAEKITEIDALLDKEMKEAKEKDTDIEFNTTDRQSLEDEILSDDYVNTKQTALNELHIELFKEAKSSGIVEKIREGLREGKMRGEIAKTIKKGLQLNQRNKTEALVRRYDIIKAVEAVDAEISKKVSWNTNANIAKSMDLNKNQEKSMKTEKLNEDITSPQEGVDVSTEQEVADEDKTSPQTTDSSETVQEDVISVEETNDKAELKKSTLDDVKIVQAKVNDIKFDTEKFQFRFDKKTDDRLSDVDWVRFNEGVVTLYQNEYGDLYAVDGHHRIEQMQERGIESVNAKILSYEDYTVEEARAIGAGLNIAEGNATSIDVAKVLRDSQLTKEELINRGVSPTSKILRDGEALANLNENIFNKVVTKGIGLERAVIIGKQLGGMEDAQNTLMKSLALTESKGKTITNDVLTELIAHARGMKQDDYEVVTLFGKETMTKDYTIERAELVSYVKNQLKSKKNLLKNISKDKNAVILQELGNKIAVDENVKNMEIADQALWILDKTTNYEGTTTNQLFNDLAKEYANADNKTAIKKKALDMLVKEMEGNKLLDETINQKVKEADIKAKINAPQEQITMQEKQINLMGEGFVEEVQSIPEVSIKISEEAKQSKVYKDTIEIANATKKNPLFNGLTIEYSNKSGKVTLTKGELESRGYKQFADQLKEGETKTVQETGSFNPNNNTITINLEGTRDTILEELIHYIQQDLENINPSYAEAIADWEYQVNKKAKELEVSLPEGKELLAQALVFTEYGYADANKNAFTEMLAVDQDIVNAFNDLLGEDILDVAKGEAQPLTPKKFRKLNISKLREALSFKHDNSVALDQNEDGTYVLVEKVPKGGFYAWYRNNQFGIVDEESFETLEGAVNKLASMNIYQLKEAQNEYNSSVVDELARVKMEDGEVNITPNGFKEIREAILTGNFVRNDYDMLVKDNPSMTQFDKDILLNHLAEAEKKGLSKPNSEVTLKEFLYRFNDIDIEEDNDISWAEVEHFFLYNIDSTMERKGFTEEIPALQNIADRLKRQHKYFQKSVQTYRNNGLQYQLKEANESIDLEMLNEQANADINYQLTETSPINADGFYSKLENHIRSNKMPNKGIGSDLYNILKKVTTQEEMEWFNLEQINNNEKYTKEDILSIMNERPIDIKENRLDAFTEFTLTKGQGLNDYTFKAYSYLNLGDYEYKHPAHFGSLKNVVAHTRYHSVDGILTDERGQQVGKDQKVMLIEELQSDLHTQGRDKGYLTTELEAEYDSKIAELREKHDNAEKVLDRDKYYNEIIALMNEKFDKVPDAPFKKGAIEFMFKQNIKDAVNGGYDGIAWTTGLQQAERWEYDGEGTGFYGSLYDNFLPRIIKKFAKKYGGEYTSIPLIMNDQVVEGQPYMAITDEMRKLVIEEGQPIFQLKEVADDNLQAIHNLGEGQFVSSLKMGGFVMPSLAITKEGYEHTRYGEISLLFDRDTIDPQRSRDNRVYSGDAYTPTYPYIAQKISESVSRDIDKRVNGVLREKKLGDTFRLLLDVDNMLDKIERYGNFKEAYQGEPAMMITYLAEKGIEFELPMTEAKYNWDYDVMDGLAKLLKDNLEIGNLSLEDYERLEPSIRATINGYYQEALGKDLLKEEMGFGNVAGLFTNLEKYNKDTTKMVIDTYATKDMLSEMVDQDGYSQWLDEISEGIVEKEGVRNNVDRFTPSGNRRKWEALHDPVTLKTLLKSMKSESEKASDAFGGIGNFRASVSDTFTSIAEIKKNAHRLQNIDEALYEEMQSEHSSRLLDLASRLADKRETNQFIATDRAIGAMVDALQSSNTKEGIMKTLGEYYGLTYDGNLVDEMMQLAYEVSQMPTEYFEAKPRRIIETKEVRGMVAPYSVSQETLDLARANGINTIVLYDAEIDGDRARAVREVTQAENILFQMTEEQNETMDEYYNKAVSMDKEYLSWVKTLKKNPNISDAMKDLLIEDDFKYNVIHNIDTMVFASKALEKHGDEYWEGVLRNPDTKASAIEFAVGQILTYKFMQNGQVERATAITDNMARKAKTLGQAIQILSVLGRQTPEGMMRYVSGMLSGLTTQSEKDLLNLQSEDVVEAFNKIDKEALKEVDFKEGAEQLTLLEPLTPKDKRSLIQKISDLANLYYKKRNFNLLNGLKELGLDEDGAKMVELFIRGKIDIATNKKKKALLEKNFKKQSYERATLDQDIIDTHNDGGIDAVRGLIAEKTGMPIFTAKDAQWVYDRSVEINKMVEGSREKDVAIARLMADIGDLIPVDKWDKVNLLQTMAQLMNAKTILRNLIGNAIFGTVDTFTHNYIGVPIDMLYSAFSGERTAIHRGIFKIAQQQWQGYGQGLKLGYEDAKLGIDTFDTRVEARLGGQSTGNKYDIRSNRTFKNEMDKVRSNDYSSIEKVKALGTTALSKLETGLNITMRATDRGAFMGAYMDSIHEQLLINKVADMKELAYEQQEQIVANATALGLYRTFNDASTMSKGFRSIKKGLNLMSSTVLGTEKWGLGDLVLKYPQTPANILQRVIDYSPIGVVQTLLLVSRATDASGYLKQKMVVDSLARGISGTSTVAIGALLAYMGIATGGVSDEPDKIYDIKKQVGLRDYGINITALRRWLNTGFKDKTAGVLRKGDMIVSYDWVEPMAVPIAVGADILLNGTEGILQTALDATATGVTALTEQPLLSGLTSLFGYGDIAKGTGNQIMGIPASFTPTLLGHIAGLIDGGNKDPYTAYSDARIAYNKVINKLPFAKGTLPDRYSVFGERLLYTPEEENFAFKVFRNIFSPAFYDRYDPEDEVSYILDLYEKTGELDIIPKAPQKSYTFDGEKFELNPQEYEEMSEWLGLQVTGRIKQALNINGFKNWSLPDQEEEIRHMLKELSKEARVKVQGMRRVE